MRSLLHWGGALLALADDPVVVKVLYFAPAEGENAALEDAIEGMGDEEVAYSITRATTPFVFAGSLELGTWDLVIAADVELCETTWQCDTVDEYVLEGNSILKLTTPGPEEEGLSEVAVVEPEVEYSVETGLGTVVGIETNVVAVAEELALVPIGCFIEWIECRFWCIHTTPPLSNARRACDQECNLALSSCEAQ